MNPFAFIASQWCTWFHSRHHVRTVIDGKLCVACMECGRVSQGVQVRASA